MTPWLHSLRGVQIFVGAACDRGATLPEDPVQFLKADQPLGGEVGRSPPHRDIKETLKSGGCPPLLRESWRSWATPLLTSSVERFEVRCMFACLFVWLFVCLFVCLSVCCVFLFLFVCFFFCLCFCVCLFTPPPWLSKGCCQCSLWISGSYYYLFITTFCKPALYDRRRRKGRERLLAKVYSEKTTSEM